MTVKDLILRSRSYRRFDEQKPVTMEQLRDLVDLARLSASAKNMQPLKYVLSCDSGTNGIIFSRLGWAGYLEDWDGPEEGERPTGYIVMLHDRSVTTHLGCDHGIAGQSILLGAAEQGLGGCMIGSVRKKELHGALRLPEHMDIVLVIALGVPVEEIVLEEIKPGGDIRYCRDSAGVHHVPKRSLESILAEGERRTE